MLRIDENPPPLTPGFRSVREFAGLWWVGHTKARFEKAFAWDLLRAGVAFYLPMIERHRYSGGRRRLVLWPLFPSYVFFCGDDEARYAALATDRLCSIITVTDQARFVDEIAAIERAVSARLPISFYPHAVPGRWCRVVRGPFAGFEGQVLRVRKRAWIVLQVAALGTSALVETDLDAVEPSDPLESWADGPEPPEDELPAPTRRRLRSRVLLS